MTTVGILGGGQLARMLALSGAPLGLRFLVMDATADACAGQFAPMVVGDYRDEAALAEFASRIDVATFDFENVPAESAQWLSERVPVFPSPARWRRHRTAGRKNPVPRAGHPRARHSPRSHRAPISTRRSRASARRAILKTRRLGYDGKGQFRLRTADDADAAWDALGAQATDGRVDPGRLRRHSSASCRWSPCAAATASSEAWPLDRKLARRRRAFGEPRARARLATRWPTQLRAYAEHLADALDYVGVFALELFCRDGELLANETGAARAQLRALDDRGQRDQPVPEPPARGARPAARRHAHGRSLPACSTGSARCRMPTPVLAEAGGHWHDYGKAPRAGRKVGHATLRAD